MILISQIIKMYHISFNMLDFILIIQIIVLKNLFFLILKLIIKCYLSLIYILLTNFLIIINLFITFISYYQVYLNS